MEIEPTDSWRRSTLGAELEELDGLLSGHTPSRAQPGYWDGDIPWATVRDLIGPLLTTTTDSITEQGLEESKAVLVPAGTVVLATRMSVGAVTVTGRACAINQDLVALFPRPGLVPKYLYHWLREQRPTLLAQAKGTTVAGLSVRDLRALPMNVPPVAEQERTVALLDKVEDSIGKTAEVAAAAASLEEALAANLLSRGHPGLHTQWSRPEDNATIPRCWPVVELGTIAQVLSGVSVGDKQRPSGEEVRYVGVADVHDGSVALEEVRTLRLSAEARQKAALRQGDILLVADHGDVVQLGRAAVVPPEAAGYAYNHLLRVRVHDPVVDSRFLALWFNGPPGRGYVAQMARTTSGLKSITPASLRRMPVALPPPDEQSEIIKALAAVHRRGERAREVLLRLQEIQLQVRPLVLSPPSFAASSHEEPA